MMRKCHLNTCPVGIATQDPILRKKFEGKPEHLINYLFLLAEDVRMKMSKLGVAKFQDLIGRTDLLRVVSEDRSNTVPAKARMLNFSMMLRNALHMRPGVNIVGGSVPQDFGLNEHLDQLLLERSANVLNGTQPRIDFDVAIVNSNRAVGSTLSYYIAKKYGDGLPAGSINISMTGSAGQSFCAFLASGVKVTLEGDANDYVAKGLSGGHVIIYPPKTSVFRSEENTIVGNACLYGATSGQVFIRGVAAERFCVRNSGAIAVVEGVGDHGCEYMTGGVVLVLGSTGRNFAAGMSGGIAFIYDRDGHFPSQCNLSMVELLALEKKQEDVLLVHRLLQEFYATTSSEVAKELIETWPESASHFVKVFPFEYQRALKLAVAEAPTLSSSAKKAGTNGHKEASPLKDIEDVIADESGVKRQEKMLDKTRGFMKYDREFNFYRPAEKRIKDWEEIYNFEQVRRGLRVQAARCMDCGVPFCQSSYGCPLGNVIPKWNEMVFQ